MIVRLAQEKDLEQILQLIKEFHSESLNAYNILYDDDIAKIAMAKLLGTSFILELDEKIVGVLGGMIVNYPGNNIPVYQEWIWYVNKEYRLHGVSLYNHLENYCKENNIKKIVMVSMANSKATKLEKFYHRLGFELLEKHYIKNLGG